MGKGSSSRVATAAPEPSATPAIAKSIAILRGFDPICGVDWWGEYFYAIGVTQGTWY